MESFLLALIGLVLGNDGHILNIDNDSTYVEFTAVPDYDSLFAIDVVVDDDHGIELPLDRTITCMLMDPYSGDIISDVTKGVSDINHFVFGEYLTGHEYYVVIESNYCTIDTVYVDGTSAVYKTTPTIAPSLEPTIEPSLEPTMEPTQLKPM
mmetsp:Transcript_47406/g.58285  ORF Transcript_47406/g.58285 Transcript_47406/m.58285 type:complete len:152 (+) Transcript_47406:59-514(+)